MMAEALAEGIGRSGVEVKVFKSSQTSTALIMKEILDAKVVLAGSGNYNNCMAPSMAYFLEKLVGNKIKGKKALGFGSYGWANLVTKEINARLEKAGFTPIQEQQVSVNFAPSSTDMDSLEKLGEDIASIVKEM